jgi:hypothetical protein
LSFVLSVICYVLPKISKPAPISDHCAACEDYCKNKCESRPNQ